MSTPEPSGQQGIENECARPALDCSADCTATLRTQQEDNKGGGDGVQEMKTDCTTGQKPARPALSTTAAADLAGHAQQHSPPDEVWTLEQYPAKVRIRCCPSVSASSQSHVGGDRRRPSVGAGLTRCESACLSRPTTATRLSPFAYSRPYSLILLMRCNIMQVDALLRFRHPEHEARFLHDLNVRQMFVDKQACIFTGATWFVVTLDMLQLRAWSLFVAVLLFTISSFGAIAWQHCHPKSYARFASCVNSLPRCEQWYQFMPLLIKFCYVSLRRHRQLYWSMVYMFWCWRGPYAFQRRQSERVVGWWPVGPIANLILSSYFPMLVMPIFMNRRSLAVHLAVHPILSWLLIRHNEK